MTKIKSLVFICMQRTGPLDVYVVGSSGVGKLKELATGIFGDIMDTNRCGVIDPDGDLVNDIVGNHDDFHNATLIEMTDLDNIVGFNPLEQQEGIDPYTQTLDLSGGFRLKCSFRYA